MTSTSWKVKNDTNNKYHIIIEKLTSDKTGESCQVLVKNGKKIDAIKILNNPDIGNDGTRWVPFGF